eukprot:TRINITY_DN72485_c0_g1_i1.p1 TRINITY_DN72485_c0_g1~~TRINITY_DN72485_c0_g1_i1.p1  ORF type:complete len:506 (-),score=107.07 TRINITY_DN72485_c0_g1_i1:50-1567(-)
MSKALEKTFDKWYGKLKHEAIKIKRQAKAVAELETPFEKNLREATSNRKWGCSNSVLHELALDAQSYKYRQKIMARAWENLKGNQEKWRRILKTLIMLEYLLKNGSDTILAELRTEQLSIRRLTSYQCREEGVDRGSGVREKAEKIFKLLEDKELLKEEREQARLHHAKLSGSGTAGGGGPARKAASMPSWSIDSGNISSSQAAELERKFERIKQEKLEERAAKEKHCKFGAGDSGDDRRGDRDDDRRDDRDRENSPRDRRRSPPREDRYGLFDPACRPARDDSGSDSDRSGRRGASPRPRSSQAAEVDLLDMMDEKPSSSAPSVSRPSSTPDWTNFCAPPASSAPVVSTTTAPAVPQASPANANFMDFVGEPESSTGSRATATPVTTGADDLFGDASFQSGNPSAGTAFGNFAPAATYSGTSFGDSGPSASGTAFGDFSHASGMPAMATMQAPAPQGFQGYTANPFGAAGFGNQAPPAMAGSSNGNQASSAVKGDPFDALGGFS